MIILPKGDEKKIVVKRWNKVMKFQIYVYVKMAN